jgi:hypothetical protein
VKEIKKLLQQRDNLPAGAFAATEDDDLLPAEWDRQAWDDEQLLIRRLLRHMLKRKSDTISKVTAAVWDKDYVNPGTISTALTRANHFLRKMRDRRTLTMPRGEGIIHLA